MLNETKNTKCSYFLLFCFLLTIFYLNNPEKHLSSVNLKKPAQLFQIQQLNIKAFPVPLSEYYVTNASFNQPNYNPNLTISDFDQVFHDDFEYLFEKEKRMSNSTEINSLRIEYLQSFCRKWPLARMIPDPSSYITVFGSDKAYECRVAKTGTLCPHLTIPINQYFSKRTKKHHTPIPPHPTPRFFSQSESSILHAGVEDVNLILRSFSKGVDC